MEKNFLILFIINIIIKISYCYIVFPFKTFHQQEPSKFNSPLDMITYWGKNIIYSSANIGTPPQNIIIFFHSQNFSSNLYYHMCDFPGSSFERKQSSSFSFIENLIKIYPMENASIASENFYFINNFNTKEKKRYKINFIYSDNDKQIQGDKYEYHDYTCMSIGLQLSYLVLHEPKSNFISQLKNMDIPTYDFTLEYLNSEEGRIIIGEELYNYDPGQYNKKYYKISGAINEKDVNSFFLNFDSIYMMKNNKQKEEIESNSCKIKIDMGLILGTEDYRQKIKNLFFDDMKKCTEEYIDRKYIYWCEKSAENDIKNNFPTLYFQMKEFYKIFELTYKDLFLEKDNKLYFLIYFESSKYNNYFEIGKIFLKKYTFTFNQYNKHIGYYNKNLNNEGEDQKENESFFQNKYLWIIFSILVFIFAILGFILGKKVRDHVRKKRLNEVDDDFFEYENQQKEDKKLFKNDDNTINE